MIIGERLRTLREAKKFSQGEGSRNERDCFAATSRVWKTGIPCQPSRHLRNLHAHLKSRFTNFFMMEKSRPTI